MAIILAPYIKIHNQQKVLSPTSNKDAYAKKYDDYAKYNGAFVRAYLEDGHTLTDTQILLALGSTAFLIYAAAEGCCDVDWEGLFKLSPATFIEYMDAAFERIAQKYPDVLEHFNKMASEKKHKRREREREMSDN